MHRALLIIGMALLVPASLPAPHSHTAEEHAMARANFQHVATVFIVETVEPCVAFWVERFGFTAENQVPGEGGKLIFASVKQGAIEIMYQTRASVVAENPAGAAELNGHSAALFITVDDLDAAERAARGAPVVKPRHQTFHGSTEFYIKDPGGNTIGFARFPASVKQ